MWGEFESMSGEFHGSIFTFLVGEGAVSDKIWVISSEFNPWPWGWGVHTIGSKSVEFLFLVGKGRG